MGEEKVVQSFSPKGLRSLIDFYNINKVQIHKLSDSIHLASSAEINYPPMKIVDMYFWITGFELDNKYLHCNG